MLDPPDLNENDSNSLPSSTCHLRRLCQGSLIKSEGSKCEFILLLPQTIFGKANRNHVILRSDDSNDIRDFHAIINKNILQYDILAQDGASVYVNGNKIECLKPHNLHPGDCILFGDKIFDSNGFIFRFEIANYKFDYPVRQNLQSLILFDNSLDYRIESFNNEVKYQKPIIFDILNSTNIQSLLQNLNYSTNYSTSMPIDSFEADSTAVYAPMPITINQSVNKLQLATKFDVDIYEVVKRIASRISKQEELSEFDCNEEKRIIQFPVIAPATNINVYTSTCSTTLTPSSSSSPPHFGAGSLDFRHTPSTSSSSFNNSDNSSGYLTNESNVNQKMSPFCADEEEEKPNVELLDEKPSTNLQILAALASKNFKSEDKPLEIFIPLATCSDEDESLSPVQKKILSPSASINRHPKNRSSRQSTHDAEDSHAHTSKQLKTQAGIELCRRRMLKYIANNMYTSQIVQFSRNSRSNSRSNLGSFEKVNNQEEVEEIMNEQATIEKSDEMDKPKPLNLYPNGEEFVTKSGSRGRRNSKKQTMLVENYTEADHRLFATLLLQLRSPRGPCSLDSTNSSEASIHETTAISDDFQPKSNEDEETPFDNNIDEEIDERVVEKILKRPSKLEWQMFLEAERLIPRIKGVGRHMAAKYRFLYRAELDRSSAETIPTQRHKLLSRCHENRLKYEEKQKQIQRKQIASTRRKSTTKRSVDQLPSPNSSRSGLKSPIAKAPAAKKHSASSNQRSHPTQTNRRQSTDFGSTNNLSIYQLAKDPNFDGFLSGEFNSKSTKCDPFSFEEDEDPFCQKAKSRPFFATENARPAAIFANAVMHNQQQKRSRKRQQSGNNSPDKSTPSSAEKPNKRQRNSSLAPRAKRGRQQNKKLVTVDKEEPCAFGQCSPQKVQEVALKSAIEWVACDSCDDWFHCICVLGLNRPVGEQETFKCQRCFQI